MPSRLLYIIIAGFAGGILLRSLYSVPERYYLFVVGGAVFFLIVSFFAQKRRGTILLVAISLVAFLFGILRLQLAVLHENHTLDASLDSNVTFTGTIVDEVERRETNQRFVFRTEDKKALVLVSTDLFPAYYYGDVLTISGVLREPENFTTDQGKEFDYVSYLGKDDIFYTMSFAKIAVLGHNAPSRVQEMLFSFKEKLTEHIDAVVPRPESTFLAGIALGSRAGISQTLRDLFITTGTIHIVALSGYNISIVAKYVQDFFGSFLSYYVSLFAGGLSIILFVLMTGAQATAVRAGIMALFAVIAKATGRTYEVSRALFIAGFLMIVHSPKILAFDVSFQLSFLATLGIVYVTPICERWLGKHEGEKPSRTMLKKIRYGLRDIVATTLAAQIMVLPFIVWKMATLSLISFPINIVILPFIPLAMCIGFVIAFLGFFGSWLTLPFGFLVTILLSAVLALIAWGAHLPHALVSVHTFPVLWMLAIYLFLFIWLFRGANKISS